MLIFNRHGIGESAAQSHMKCRRLDLTQTNSNPLHTGHNFQFGTRHLARSNAFIAQECVIKTTNTTHYLNIAGVLRRPYAYVLDEWSVYICYTRSEHT